MSPRAACRLEALGFVEVYDYVLGKADWLAHDLPVEGEQANAATAGRAARDDAVTCALTDPVAQVRERMDTSPYRFAIVASPSGVVLGRLGRRALNDDPDARAEDLMEPGPSTVRPDLAAQALARRLDERDLRMAIVTTPEGRLIGVAWREDL
jgi:CBS domain-containing protein